MFGVSGVEFMVILLVALIVLGPEKLPEAVRKTGRVVGELRRMSNGFQAELRDALDEPYKEVKGTFDSARQTLKDTAGAVTSGFDMTPTASKPAASAAVTEPTAPATAAVDGATESQPEAPTPPDPQPAANGAAPVESAASAPAENPEATPADASEAAAADAAPPRQIPPGAPPLAS